MSSIRAYMLRTVRRPWPWMLRYLLVTLPTVVLAPLLLLPLASWFRVPLLREALETRSLDLLLEILIHPPQAAAPGPWLALVVLLVPVAWLVVRTLGLLVEGGILSTYARDDRMTARAFVQAGFRWFGSFLLLTALAAALVVLLALVVTVAVVLVRMLWRPLATVVLVLGGVVILGALLWFELARAAAVVRDDRHVLRALRCAARVAIRRPLPLLAVVGSTLGLRVLLVVVTRLIAGGIPVSWWLPTLVAYQIIQVVAVGLNLVRQAGEVGLMARFALQDGAGG